MKESKLWTIFLFSGLAMVILLGIHMFGQHMNTFLSFFGIETGDPLAYNSVMGRAASLGWTIFYIVLLAVGLYHGLYGIRTIIIELAPNSKSAVSSILLIVGLAAFIFGSYITVTSYGMGGVL